MKIYYRALVWLSGLGLIASACWHILTLVGIELSRPIWMPLFVGIFVIWLPAVVSALPQNERIREAPRDAWQILFEAAPTWMCLAPRYIGIYAALNWVITTGGLGRITDADPHFTRVGSGIAMLFYSAALGILYSSGARASARHCSEGHIIYPGQKFCPVCGPPPDQSARMSMGHGA